MLLACCCYCNADITLHRLACTALHRTAPSLRARPAIPEPEHCGLEE